MGIVNPNIDPRYRFPDMTQGPRINVRRVGARIAEGGKNVLGGIGILTGVGDVLYVAKSIGAGESIDPRVAVAMGVAGTVLSAVGYGFSRLTRRLS